MWALYGQRVLDVQHLGGDSSARATPETYSIGESHNVALLIPPAGLPHGHGFALVQGRTLNFTASMRGEVICGGETLSLRALVRGGHATACRSTYSYTLQPGARCRVAHNAITFFVNLVPPEEPLRLESQWSSRLGPSNARVLVLLASVLAAAYLAGAPAGEADVEIDHRLVKNRVVAFSTPPTPGQSRSLPNGDFRGDSLTEGVTASPGQGRGVPGDGPRGGYGAEDASEIRGDAPKPATSRGTSSSGVGEGSGDDPDEGRGSASNARGSNTSSPRSRVSTPGDGDGHASSASTRAAAASERDREMGRDGEVSRRVSVNNSIRCETLDLLAIEATIHTHPSKLMRVGPCKVPDLPGIPQRARNFGVDELVRSAGIQDARQAGILGVLAARSQAELDNRHAANPLQLGDGDAIWSGIGTRHSEPRGGLQPHRARNRNYLGPGSVGQGRELELAAPSSRGVPRIRRAHPRIKGQLDRDIIDRIVGAHINEVRHCYDIGLVRRPKIRGRVAVTFTIQARDNTSATRVSRSSLRDKTVEGCIAAAVRRWKFPKPQDGGKVVVTYPFVLDRDSPPTRHDTNGPLPPTEYEVQPQD